MEKAILNIDVLNISQGMNGDYSHKGDLAIDITNCIYLKAPFTGTIKRVYEKCNAVWLESLEKVEYADGTIDYMTVLTMHDNDVSNLKVGQVIKQGEIYYHPGVKGRTTGSHIHIAVGKGKFTANGWYQGQYQPKSKCYSWPINNQYDITKALFLHSDVKVENGWYEWKESVYTEIISQAKTIEELAYEVIKGIWGNNPERKQKLIESGYDYNAIQVKVNQILNPISSILYTVEKGDYLIKIGKKFNKSWKEIAKNNNIKFPYIIYAGQKLII